MAQGVVTITSSESEIYVVISWRLPAKVKAFKFNGLHGQQR